MSLGQIGLEIRLNLMIAKLSRKNHHDKVGKSVDQVKLELETEMHELGENIDGAKQEHKDKYQKVRDLYEQSQYFG